MYNRGMATTSEVTVTLKRAMPACTTTHESTWKLQYSDSKRETAQAIADVLRGEWSDFPAGGLSVLALAFLEILGQGPVKSEHTYTGSAKERAIVNRIFDACDDWQELMNKDGS